MAASADEPGRVDLVARVDPSDRIVHVGGDLRVASTHPPPPVATLLAARPVLDPDHPNSGTTVHVGGDTYLVTMRELAAARGGTTGWFVAVLVPETYYTPDLVQLERQFLQGFAATLLLVSVIGALTIGAVRQGLERAKTVVRAMGKYVPVELVRDLYATNEEPSLGPGCRCS